MMRCTLGAALALLLAVSVSACGDEEEGSWPVPAAAASEFEGLVWAKDNTFGDLTGPLFDVDPAPISFVLAGGGIYYGARNGELFYADGKDVTKVRSDAVPATMRASADGRWLAFIEEEPHPDEAVVIDTRTATEVLRSAEKMETGTGPDDLYPEGQYPGIEMIDDDVVWIRADHGYLKFGLQSRELETGPFDFEGRDDEGPDGWVQPWYADRIQGGQGFWNPSRTSYITNGFNRDSRIVDSAGTSIRPALEGDYWILGWLDDDTVYGRNYSQLITCSAPIFSCTEVPGALGDSGHSGNLEPGEQNVRLPNGMNWNAMNHVGERWR